MQSLFRRRRVLLGMTGAIAMAAPAITAASAEAHVLPLNVTVPVSVGSADVYAGPAGMFTVPVNASGTATVQLTTVNPLFVTVVAQPCPNGGKGALFSVSTIDSPVTGSVSITTNAGTNYSVPVTVGPLSTGLVGVCVNNTSV